jgi:hypothetical protein
LKASEKINVSYLKAELQGRKHLSFEGEFQLG